MPHILLGLIPLGVIFAAAISVLFPDDPSRKTGAHNNWMNADYAAREEKKRKDEAKREKALGRD